MSNNKRSTTRSAFSLVELLVALSILAVVSAIIVPRFLNVKTRAEEQVMQTNFKELNNIYSNWVALGGKLDPNGWYISGSPVYDAYTMLTASYVFAYLCETGSSTVQASGNFRQTNVWPEMFKDALGPWGSSNISISVDCTPSAEEWLEVGTTSRITATSPAGFIYHEDFRLYYKLGNRAYLVLFSPTASPSFWIDTTISDNLTL